MIKAIRCKRIEELLNRFEKEHKRYFYYRYITKGIKAGNKLNLHSFITIINDKASGASIKDEDIFDEETADKLSTAFKFSIKEEGGK